MQPYFLIKWFPKTTSIVLIAQGTANFALKQLINKYTKPILILLNCQNYNNTPENACYARAKMIFALMGILWEDSHTLAAGILRKRIFQSIIIKMYNSVLFVRVKKDAEKRM